MKTMRDMHEKMMNAKTPEDRGKLMADHMKTMRDGMAMMGGMSGTGMGDMKSVQGMTADMGAHQRMMAERMEMMQSMMQMMMDRMPVRLPGEAQPGLMAQSESCMVSVK